MPFYEYECRACGALTEVLQKISDKPLRKCPECGKSALVKLVSAPIFRLKGSGWYETDFKGEQDRKRNLAGEGEEKKPDAKEGGEAKSAAAEDSAAAPKAETKADAKADTKSDTKSESKAKPKAKPAHRSTPRKAK